jgi:uncharacterized protein (TIGR03118 family)
MRISLALILPAFAVAFAADAREPAFKEIDLVSDIPGRAKVTDPHLVNPWGLVANPVGPWWVADNGTGLSTLYGQNGNIVPFFVTLEPPGGVSPTGIVFNGDKNKFKFTHDGNSSAAVFMWSSEDGFIEAWDPFVPPPPPSTHGFIQVNNSTKGCDGNTVDCGSVYKGLALATNEEGKAHLYATDFRNAHVDVFDSNFNEVDHPGMFEDKNIPAGFAPFGIAHFGESIFVTYAMQDEHKHDDVAGPGNGFVDEFTLSGRLIRRVFSGAPLNSPWGLAFAPESFGLEEDLLIGNFGDGHINIFKHHHHHFVFVDALEDVHDQPIVIEGLWSIVFGPGNPNAGPRNVLFFTAGISDGQGGPIEAHGLFGKILRVGHGDDDD